MNPGLKCTFQTDFSEKFVVMRGIWYNNMNFEKNFKNKQINAVHLLTYTTQKSKEN